MTTAPVQSETYPKKKSIIISTDLEPDDYTFFLLYFARLQKDINDGKVEIEQDGIQIIVGEGQFNRVPAMKNFLKCLEKDGIISKELYNKILVLPGTSKEVYKAERIKRELEGNPLMTDNKNEITHISNKISTLDPKLKEYNDNFLLKGIEQKKVTPQEVSGTRETVKNHIIDSCKKGQKVEIFSLKPFTDLKEILSDIRDNAYLTLDQFRKTYLKISGSFNVRGVIDNKKTLAKKAEYNSNNGINDPLTEANTAFFTKYTEEVNTLLEKLPNVHCSESNIVAERFGIATHLDLQSKRTELDINKFNESTYMFDNYSTKKENAREWSSLIKDLCYTIYSKSDKVSSFNQIVKASRVWNSVTQISKIKQILKILNDTKVINDLQKDNTISELAAIEMEDSDCTQKRFNLLINLLKPLVDNARNEDENTNKYKGFMKKIGDITTEEHCTNAVKLLLFPASKNVKLKLEGSEIVLSNQGPEFTDNEKAFNAIGFNKMRQFFSCKPNPKPVKLDNDEKTVIVDPSLFCDAFLAVHDHLYVMKKYDSDFYNYIPNFICPQYPEDAKKLVLQYPQLEADTDYSTATKCETGDHKVYAGGVCARDLRPELNKALQQVGGIQKYSPSLGVSAA